MPSLLKRLSLLAAVSLLAACSQDVCCSVPPPDPTKDIVETAAATPEFSTLVTALKAADLVATLKGPGPFTMFAPNNDAFASLPPGTLAQLLQPPNKETLRAILLHHVVPRKLVSGDLYRQTVTAPTADGGDLLIDGTGVTVTVGEAAVIDPDMLATNGVIHVIDAVLQP